MWLCGCVVWCVRITNIFKNIPHSFFSQPTLSPIQPSMDLITLTAPPVPDTTVSQASQASLDTHSKPSKRKKRPESILQPLSGLIAPRVPKSEESGPSGSNLSGGGAVRSETFLSGSSAFKGSLLDTESAGDDHDQVWVNVVCVCGCVCGRMWR